MSCADCRFLKESETYRNLKAPHNARVRFRYVVFRFTLTEVNIPKTRSAMVYGFQELKDFSCKVLALLKC